MKATIKVEVNFMVNLLVKIKAQNTIIPEFPLFAEVPAH